MANRFAILAGNVVILLSESNFVLFRWKQLSPVIHPSSALNLYHYMES